MSEDIAVLSGGSLANNSTLREHDELWDIEGDPTEAAFLVAEQKLGVTQRRRRRFTRIGEVPFTSDRKLMSTMRSTTNMPIRRSSSPKAHLICFSVCAARPESDFGCAID